MKKQFLFSTAIFILLGTLSGCHHKPISATIAVQNVSSLTTVVYGEKGGYLRFASADSHGFEVTFPFGSPCNETKLTSPDGTEVQCVVTGVDGHYFYQVAPYNKPPGSPTSPPPAYNLAQVGGCTNCKGALTHAGKPTVEPDYVAYIGCPINGVAIQVPPPLPAVTPGQLIEWVPAAPPPAASNANGATFASKNPNGSAALSPCEGGYGPYYEANQCKIPSSTPPGNYTYTVTRSDCTSPSANITLTVQ